MSDDIVKREPGVAPTQEDTPAEEDASVKEEVPEYDQEGDDVKGEQTEDEPPAEEVKEEMDETDMIKEEEFDADWDNMAIPTKDKKEKKEKKSRKKEKKKRKQAERELMTAQQPPAEEEGEKEDKSDLVPKKKREKVDMGLLNSKLEDLHNKLSALQNQSASITQELKHGGKEQRFQEEREFKRWKNTKKADKRQIDDRCTALLTEIATLKEQKETIQGTPFAGSSARYDLSNKKLTPVRVNRKNDAAKHAAAQTTLLLNKMDSAAAKDLILLRQGKPAVEKLRLLSEVNRVCHRAGFQESLIGANLLKKLQIWLRPPDGGLPVYQIRHTILNILNDLPYQSDPGRVRLNTESWPGVSKDVLLETELGTDIRRFANDPNETHENRILATKLMEKWSREICGLSKNYKKLQSQEKDSGRTSRFKPERFVMAADVPKYYANGERFHADKNTDGEAAAQRCRVPQAMMPDFINRPAYTPVAKMFKTPMRQQLERNIRNLRETRDRALTMSIEGSASTLQAESVPKKTF